jgi:nucleotide-binding universal stress UspA family protein
MSFAPRTILTALDGSLRAPEVFAAAAALAAQFKAKLYVFRALVVPPDFPAAAANPDGDPLPQLMRRQALEELKAIVGTQPSVCVEPPMIEIGAQPWRAILAAAERLDVDLLVLGSHGYGGLDYVLGTTAAKVVNHVRRDVLIVQHRWVRPSPGEAKA